MKLIKQLRNTINCCGQCVVAMISNTLIEKVLLKMGEGYTSIYSLQNGLFEFGILTEEPLEIKSEKELSNQVGAILIDVKNSKNKRFEHWIAWDGKEIFDPKFGCRKTLNRISSESIEKALFFPCKYLYKEEKYERFR